MISRVPVRWRPGFHGLYALDGGDFPPSKSAAIDPALYLLHLRAVDVLEARRRIKILNRTVFSASDLEKNYGYQFRLNEEQYVDRHFPVFEPEEIETKNASFDLALVAFLKNIVSGEASTAFDFTNGVYRTPERLIDAITLLPGGRLDVELPNDRTYPSAAEWSQQLFEACYRRALS